MDIKPLCYDSRFEETNYTTTVPTLPLKNRKLYQWTEQDYKIQNCFSLSEQSAAILQISSKLNNTLHSHMQNKFYLSKNRVKTIGITLEKWYIEITLAHWPLYFSRENGA